MRKLIFLSIFIVIILTACSSSKIFNYEYSQKISDQIIHTFAKDYRNIDTVLTTENKLVLKGDHKTFILSAKVKADSQKGRFKLNIAVKNLFFINDKLEQEDFLNQLEKDLEFLNLP